MKSKLAIASFILGVISLLWIVPGFGNIQIPFIISLFILLCPLIGLITGIFSVIVIKKENLEGRWFAYLGIILSIIGLLALILFVAGMIGFLRSWF